jgi:hypothetical protein
MKKHLCENIVGYPITTREKNDCVKQILGWIKSGEMITGVGQKGPVFQECHSSCGHDYT